MKLIHEVIDRAFDGYNEILNFMLQTIDKPRDHVNTYAPKIFSFMVPVEKIKDVIGKGGDVINKIIEECDNIKIDFEEDGTCFLTHPDQAMIDKALEKIKDITEDLEIGAVYDAVIARVEAYGVFVDLPKKKSALCHVSKLGPQFTEDVSKSFKVGDKMKVKILGVDEKGRINVKRELA
jgi:polyribonucleotide nucleotidyltransferase